MHPNMSCDPELVPHTAQLNPLPVSDVTSQTPIFSSEPEGSLKKDQLYRFLSTF